MRMLRHLVLLPIFSALLPHTAQALTLKEFVSLKKEEQIIYLYGVMDAAIIESTPSGRNECAERWGVVNAYNHLVNWYNRDPVNPANTNINVALLVHLEIDKICSKELSTRKQKP
jgi:hypothetical protein